MRYQNRISSPLLDRIDIHVEVPRVDYEELSSVEWACRRRRFASGSSGREKQRVRFAGTKMLCNGDMGPEEVRRFCVTDDAGRSLLRAAMQQMQMSA